MRLRVLRCEVRSERCQVPARGVVARAWFWLVLVGETLFWRRLSALVRARLRGLCAAEVTGSELLPVAGTFILAVNHYKATRTLDLLAVALAAASEVRPDLADRFLIIVGQRPPRPGRPRPLPTRMLRRLMEAWFQRWSGHVLRVPSGGHPGSARVLRAWRARSLAQPVLVFPEGRASPEFREVRRGAGRWLASLPVPTVPVAAWEEEHGWRVRFGPSLHWASCSDLHDAQLGLALANLLPSHLAPRWQPTLERWRNLQRGG